MKIITVKRKKIDYNDYIRRSALETDYSTLFRESVKLVDADDGKVKVIYQELDLDESEIVAALKRVKYVEGERSRGLKSISRIFGFAPRIEFRQNYCRVTSLARENPKEHAIICSYAKKVAEIYFKQDPETYLKHEKMAEKVLNEYRIEGTPFTSGIINKNNPLKYHFDTGNFKDVYSCMLAFKKDISGGYLALPEYDCALEIRNNSILIFDGQNILHGVTPFKLLSKDAYRYTIVYYSLRRMWECLTVDEEIARIRNIRQDIEMRRARGELAETIVKRAEKLKREGDFGYEVR
jgi:hypothetical protein